MTEIEQKIAEMQELQEQEKQEQERERKELYDMLDTIAQSNEKILQQLKLLNKNENDMQSNEESEDLSELRKILSDFQNSFLAELKQVLKEGLSNL